MLQSTTDEIRAIRAELLAIKDQYVDLLAQVRAAIIAEPEA